MLGGGTRYTLVSLTLSTRWMIILVPPSASIKLTWVRLPGMYNLFPPSPHHLYPPLPLSAGHRPTYPLSPCVVTSLTDPDRSPVRKLDIEGTDDRSLSLARAVHR